jgi:hypothetical protein
MNSSRWMKLVVLVLSLLVIIPTMALAQTGGGSGGSGGISNFTLNNPQPVLIYTVWGGTVAGTNASTLVVYDNGLAIWAQSDAGSLSSGSSGIGTGSGNNVQVIQITSTQINDLRTQLRRAGAFRQHANNSSPTSLDTPLTTITVFSNPGNGRNTASLAQTFSFYEGQGTRANINNIFTDFFNNNFNGSGSGSTSGGS